MQKDANVNVICILTNDQLMMSKIHLYLICTTTEVQNRLF